MDRMLKYSGIFQKILISAAIIAALMLSMDFSKLALSFGKMHISAWLIATVLCYVQILALSYRWLKLVNIYEEKISFTYALKTNLACLLANYLFITSIGGIIIRIAMNVKVGVSLIRSLAATAIDRMFTLLALIVLSILFLPVLSDVVSTDIHQRMVFLLLGLIFASVFIGFLLLEGPRKKIIFSHRKVAICFQYLRSVLTKKHVFAEVLVSSLLAQTAHFTAVYFIMTSMGIDFSLLHFMAIIPIITIVASLPIGYGGWGIREGAFVYGLGLIHVPFEAAFAASIQVGIISMGGALLLGIPALASSDLKQIFSFKKVLFKNAAH